MKKLVTIVLLIGLAPNFCWGQKGKLVDANVTEETKALYKNLSKILFV